MKRKMLRLFVFCMFTGLLSGFLSTAASAQEMTGQDPVLMVKVRDINQLLSDVEKLMPQTPGSKAGQQIAMVRGMLQGTDWIDSGRSIVAGMVLEAPQPKWVIMIPFITENAGFQQAFNAIAGNGSYMLAVPPQPGLSVSPALENSLVRASNAPMASNLVFEAAAGQLLDMLQPQMAAIAKKIETAPAEQVESSGMTPQQLQSILDSTMQTLRQVDILRFGLDLSEDIFTLHFDVDALPGSDLAGMLVDQGGDSRLMSYKFDDPIQYRSRAHNMAGMFGLMKSSLGKIYSQLGIDFDDMTEITQAFTGEMAGGIRISADGLGMEMVAVMQPGIDGEDFVQNTYMPFFERYNKQISDLAAQTGKPGPDLYERTADSTVSGIKVMGVKTNLGAVIPPDQQKDNPLANQALEMRMAGEDDLIFFASNDAKMEELIAKSHNLVASPAQGPTASFDIDLGAFFRDIQAMMPPEKAGNPLPGDLGKVTMQADIRDGKIATRTSFNMAEIQKLVSTISSAASKANTNPNPAVN